jgi:hypothetical protein
MSGQFHAPAASSIGTFFQFSLKDWMVIRTVLLAMEERK